MGASPAYTAAFAKGDYGFVFAAAAEPRLVGHVGECLQATGAWEKQACGQGEFPRISQRALLFGMKTKETDRPAVARGSLPRARPASRSDRAAGEDAARVVMFLCSLLL